MVFPLSIDLRLRVAVSLGEGETVRTVAKRFGVSVASAVRIGQRERAGRGQVPGKIGGHRRQLLVGEVGDWLVTRLAEKPDLTIRALTAELAVRGVRVRTSGRRRIGGPISLPATTNCACLTRTPQKSAIWG